jgi:predicted MFS family arabinose efflux permease
MTLGPASGGFLAMKFGLRQVFLISGGLQLLVVILALLFLPQGPPRHKTDLRSALSGSIFLLRNNRLIACLLATVVSCIGFGVFLTFLPLYASTLGYDPAQVGLVFAAQAVTNVVGRVPIGKLADRVDRRWLVSSGLFCLAAALFALGQVTALSQMLACSVLLGVGMALTFTAIGALIAELVPPLQRGLSMGMYNSCIYLGMMCGSTFMGLLLQRIGYFYGFAAAGGVALVALTLFLAMFRERTTAGFNRH